MKKQITSMLSAAAAVITLCASVLPASAVSIRATKRMGDINGDNAVNLSDALTTLSVYAKAAAELETVEAATDNYAADIDMNGTIDLRDAMNILRYYSKVQSDWQPLWADLRETSYVTGWNYNEGRSPFTLTGMYLEIGCAAGKPGEEVTVPVYVAGMNQIAGFQYYQFIPEGLEVTAISCPISEIQPGNEPSWNLDYENWEVVDENEDGTYNYKVNGHGSALVWVTEGGRNIDVSDGTILANITYKIPEDAKPGDAFPLTADTDTSKFVLDDGDNAYQYTLVGGFVGVL